MNITIISASPREGRLSLGVAKHLNNKIENSILIDLGEFNIPRFTGFGDTSGDLEQLRETLTKSDAFIIISPEYNGGYPGILKDLIDHCSRETFANKTVGIASVSAGAMAGVRVANHLKDAFFNIQSIVSPRLLMAGNVGERFSTEGKLIDDSFQGQVDSFIESIQWLGNKIKD